MTPAARPPAPTRTQQELGRVERELNATRLGMQRDIDQLKDLASPSAWFDKAKDWARRWTGDLLSNRSHLLIIGGVVAGAVLIGWALSGSDDDERPAGGVIVRRERPSFFGRMLWTALQTFLLYYARKVLVEYLSKEPAPAPAAAPADLPTPFSQTP